MKKNLKKNLSFLSVVVLVVIAGLMVTGTIDAKKVGKQVRTAWAQFFSSDSTRATAPSDSMLAMMPDSIRAQFRRPVGFVPSVPTDDNNVPTGTFVIAYNPVSSSQSDQSSIAGLLRGMNVTGFEYHARYNTTYSEQPTGLSGVKRFFRSLVSDGEQNRLYTLRQRGVAFMVNDKGQIYDVTPNGNLKLRGRSSR